MEPADTETRQDSPWLQAGRLGFRALYALTCLAGIAWLASNVREIGPDSQVVVYRLGAIERVQQSGLVVAWPSPFERIALLPSSDRVLQLRIESLQRKSAAPPPLVAKLDVEQTEDGFAGESGEDEVVHPAASRDSTAGSGYLLTGDGGVIQLDVTLFYKVSDPYDYALEQDHVVAALDRLATRSAVVLCAARDLDSILVARPELIDADSDAAERRERLRGELVESINRSLAALTSEGAGLGVEVTRVDIQSKLPDAAVDSFNAVLTAGQLAEQQVAAARNDAAKEMQTATQNANQILQAAQASADETTAKARSDTAAIASLARVEGGAGSSLPMRVYRERIPAILAHAAGVTLVDPAADSKLILQGVANDK